MTAREYKFAVVGGGLVGAAIGWGLARLGKRVAVLDEGDIAYRASRGNFALVWVQSKGLGMPAMQGGPIAPPTVGRAGRRIAEETGLDVASSSPAVSARLSSETWKRAPACSAPA